MILPTGSTNTVMASLRLNSIKVWVKTQVSAQRYHHIQGVAKTAGRLAKHYGLPVEKAKLAGWLHDCAKELTKSEMLQWIKKSPFPLDSEEKKLPALWHPHAGAAIAFKKWGIKDVKVLEAIRCHTLGHPLMSPLAQVIFVADFIEPGRDFDGLLLARQAARANLRQAVLCKCSMTMAHLLNQNMKIHDRLLKTWNEFLQNEK